jgi:hypothetical protein
MATKVRNTHPICSTFCTSHNALKAQIGAGSSFHLDQSESTISAANASDLDTSLTLCNQLIAVIRFHFADTLAHKTTDATSLPSLGAGISLATAITAANLMKASYNTHRASTTYHYNADATNVVAAADATDQTSLNTLLNELKTDLNAHMASGPAAASLRLVSA